MNSAAFLAFSGRQGSRAAAGKTRRTGASVTFAVSKANLEVVAPGDSLCSRGNPSPRPIATRARRGASGWPDAAQQFRLDNALPPKIAAPLRRRKRLPSPALPYRARARPRPLGAASGGGRDGRGRVSAGWRNQRERARFAGRSDPQRRSRPHDPEAFRRRPFALRSSGAADHAGRTCPRRRGWLHRQGQGASRFFRRGGIVHPRLRDPPFDRPRRQPHPLRGRLCRKRDLARG